MKAAPQAQEIVTPPRHDKAASGEKRDCSSGRGEGPPREKWQMEDIKSIGQ